MPVLWESQRIPFDAECRARNHFLMFAVPQKDAGAVAVQQPHRLARDQFEQRFGLFHCRERARDFEDAAQAVDLLRRTVSIRDDIEACSRRLTNQHRQRQHIVGKIAGGESQYGSGQRSRPHRHRHHRDARCSLQWHDDPGVLVEHIGEYVLRRIGPAPTPRLTKDSPFRATVHRPSATHSQLTRHFGKLLSEEIIRRRGNNGRGNQSLDQFDHAHGVVGLNQTANLRPRNPFGGHGGSLS